MYIPGKIAEELNVKTSRIEAAIDLFDGGATIPFIARYRKEQTGGLDDAELRRFEERLIYLRELDERRSVILASIEAQGKLDDELKKKIEAADGKSRLEDLYLPYKPKRRTKASIAREAGLEPLARSLLENPDLDPDARAREFIDAEKGIASGGDALEGAAQILMETFSEDADLFSELREWTWRRGFVEAVLNKRENDAEGKFADYYEYTEPVKKIPAHRALALFRGRNEEVLTVKLRLDDRAGEEGLRRASGRFSVRDRGRRADGWLLDTVEQCWKKKLLPRLELAAFKQLREEAEDESIRVFSSNLRDLLLAAPAGPRVILGLDPGYRTGVKAAVIDETGKLLDTATIYPHVPRRAWKESLAALDRLVIEFDVDLVSIGNGTASRETDRLVGELIQTTPEKNLRKIIVSEAGASVYSASSLAAAEFPDLDVSLRGAVSIARRVQDPLAELVKIEPKSIGVGQYQHDVNQAKLGRALDTVVEDCVNAVGVNVNTASGALLNRVSGLNATLAGNIVEYRETNGPFTDRKQLKKVPRLGGRTFEQAAGFLRIENGDNPLDGSAVHPESYGLVKRILETTGRSLDEITGDGEFLESLDPRDFITDRFGLPTVRDVLAELDKPGRDPRPEFKTAELAEGVEEIGDLKPGMKLEGTVTSVTNFGAFVDIGVHQDGLVHISKLADRFVKDPRQIVKTGDIVSVTVIGVEPERRRISLSMVRENGPG